MTSWRRLDVPEQCVELHRLLIDDIDLPATRELWARLWPLCRLLEAPELSGRGQRRLSSGGDAAGLVRPPLVPLDDAAIGELAGLLDQATLAPIAPGLSGS